MEEKPKKAHKCKVCKKSFSRPSKLTLHIQAVHEGKKPYNCVICDKSFSSKSYLKKHKKAVHDVQENKPHKCSSCPRDFSCPLQLKFHVETVHEGKEPYECSLCGKVFSGRGRKRHFENAYQISA